MAVIVLGGYIGHMHAVVQKAGEFMFGRRLWQVAMMMLGLGGFAAVPLFGSPISFNFGGGPGALGTSAVFTSGGLKITAYGYIGIDPNDLFQKNGGISETGLGLNNTPDNEINPDQSIIFDVSDLISDGITGGTFTLGSLQTGELGEACILSSNIPFSTGSCAKGLAGNGSSIGTVTLNWGSDDFVEFITDPKQPVGPGNYLVDTLTVATTPEPPTLILFGTMLLGLALVTRRRWAGTLN